MNNQSDSELLQRGLIKLGNREKTWQMKFNPVKCYVIPLNLIIYFITIYYNQLDFYLSNLTGTILLIKVRYSLQQSHLKKKNVFSKKDIYEINQVVLNFC